MSATILQFPPLPKAQPEPRAIVDMSRLWHCTRCNAPEALFKITSAGDVVCADCDAKMRNILCVPTT